MNHVFEQGQSNREKDAPIFVEFIRADIKYAESFTKSDRVKHCFHSNTFIDIVIICIPYFIQRVSELNRKIQKGDSMNQENEKLLQNMGFQLHI